MRVVEEVTGKPRVDGLKELLLAYIDSKIKDYRQRIRRLEAKYGMSFEEFRKKMGKELPLDWEHEKDGIEWETAITELEELKKLRSKYARELRKESRAGC